MFEDSGADGELGTAAACGRQSATDGRETKQENRCEEKDRCDGKDRCGGEGESTAELHMNGRS